MKLDLDDLQRRAEASIADTRGQVCWHDARTALALILRIRELEAETARLREDYLMTEAEASAFRRVRQVIYHINRRPEWGDDFDDSLAIIDRVIAGARIAP